MFEAANFPRFNLYEALGLSTPGSGRACSAEQIKTAYRRALLKYHPDKAKAVSVDDAKHGGQESKQESPKFSIDDISKARDILLDASLRVEYDRHLQAQIASDAKHGFIRPDLAGTGLETIDLEDMDYSEDTETYTRACRCGNDVGFQVLETELAAEVDTGEVVVSCPGCSLAVRIVFQVDEA